jgi:hypothetical protein
MLYHLLDLSRWHFSQSLNPVFSKKRFSVILYKKGGVICYSWQRLYSFLTVCNFQTFFILAIGAKKINMNANKNMNMNMNNVSMQSTYTYSLNIISSSMLKK